MPDGIELEDSEEVLGWVILDEKDAFLEG